MSNVDAVTSDSSLAPPVPSPGALVVALERAMSAAPGSDLATVARLIGTSKRSLQRALVRDGLTFQVMRTGIRLARAEALLAERHTKVSAVAGDVGFASVGHFILWFRRHRGTTPGAWRTRATQVEGGAR